MRLEYQILIAFGLDLLLGDPRWLPHPVKLIGHFALWLEPLCRKVFGDGFASGCVAWLIIVGLTGGVTWGAVHAAGLWHPLAADVLGVLLIYTALAARDLAQHAHNVYAALKAEDLPEARRRVGFLVGRDTQTLDESGIVRAAVESVAESLVDGVTAPLFFAMLGGPVGALVYKAINTLDSTFGYKTERYLRFGWASARADDVANFIPARITAPLIALAALPLGGRPLQALRIWWRDGRKHESPNSGLSEAAVAGALNVQLGGLNHYAGEALEKPVIGDPGEPLRRGLIWRANLLMFASAALALLVYVGLRAGALQFLKGHAG